MGEVYTWQLGLLAIGFIIVLGSMLYASKKKKSKPKTEPTTND